MGTINFGVEDTMWIHVEKNANKIQEYIKNQLMEDQAYDQLSLKEYIDPFTGEPVMKGK